MAQKNSEATRALAVQEDVLEKELGEIQKVLLAMQVYTFQNLIEFILATGTFIPRSALIYCVHGAKMQFIV